MLTFESDYSTYNLVDQSFFIDHIKPCYTNNPDFVLRVSLEYLLGNNI